MKTLQLGGFQVDRVVESEGPFAPLDFLLPGIAPDLVAAHSDWLQPRHVDPADGQAIMAFQSFVLRTRRHTIVIDTCVGNDKPRPLRPTWHLQQRPFLARMQAAGVAPEAVDFVLCTHLHADHVGWNTRLAEGRWVPTFPNARYVFARREYEHWERAHRAALASGAEVPNHGSFADSVLPVMEAGRAVLVDTDHAIEDGVRLEAAPGHTPGNCVLHAQDGKDHAVFAGDVFHTAVQLADPSLSSRFCADPVASARTRAALCERYADTGTALLAAHFPAPVAGRIVRHRDAFRLDA